MAGTLVSEKLHAACDECRTRKLKCSGHHPICNRCEREKITCQYSPQKPMGRPRKRRRDDDGSMTGAAEGEQQEPLVNTQVPNGPIDNVTGLGFDDLFGTDVFQSDPGFSMDHLPQSFPAITMDSVLTQEATPPTVDFDPSMIDPSLWMTPTTNNNHNHNQNTNTPQSNHSDTGPCDCLSLMYLTLTDLQSITNFSFPQIVPRLRSGITAVHTILHCPKCPKEHFAAMQNVQSTSSLLSALAERYHRTLAEIESEAARAEAAGQKKAFRVGDNSPENRHLHTGGVDCPMGFDVQIEPRDWEKLCKAAIKTEVVGGGSYQMPLSKVLDEMEERQRQWHVDKSMQSEARSKMFGTAVGECRDGDGGALCLRMVNSVRRMISGMPFDNQPS